MGNNQKQSHAITNMVVELNATIKMPYFTAKYCCEARTYELVQTELGKQVKLYDFLLAGPITYAEMFHYLNGVLLGIRANNVINKNNKI